MADEYDLTSLKASELEAYSGTLTKAHLVVVIVGNKPYTATVEDVQDAA